MGPVDGRPEPVEGPPEPGGTSRGLRRAQPTGRPASAKSVVHSAGGRQTERMRPSFVPGLELSRLFYRDQVRPLLDQLGGPEHSAALIGHGSEVLGFDTERSTDHDWGPRVLIFLADDEAARETG